MAMIKVFSPAGWDFDTPVASLIKIASGGLRGNDRRDFVKRANGAENIFLPYLDSIKFAADEEPVHLIAVGASEAYGPNRNADAFTEKTCKDYHDTFVKFARWFRNHKNKDPNISYGTVKLSAYNPVMRRIELLCALNKEKSAAERNGGFVADRELEKLARNEPIAVSMACRVAHDVCSACGHKARTRDEYCDSSMCKAGGCKENLTRLIKRGNDVHILHVLNPQPAFFDISNVLRPADRIAYADRADWLQKAAADLGFSGVDGAKIAEDLGIMAPLAVILSQDTMLPGEWSARFREQVKLAYGLADAENLPSMQLSAEIRRAFTRDMQPDLDLNSVGLDEPRQEKTAAALGALADQKIVLSLRDFARMTKRAELIEEAAAGASGVYQRMIADGSLERRISSNPYAPAEKLASYTQRTQAVRLRETYALEKSAVERRCQLSTLRQQNAPHKSPGTEKRACDNAAAEELIRDYAIYKLAALQRISQFDTEFPLTCCLAICQNQVV